MKNFLKFVAFSSFNFYVELRRAFWPIRAFFSKSITIAITNTEKIKVLTNGEIVKTLYAHEPKIFFNRGFESKTISIMQDQVKTGMVALDIGANIGMYTILLSRLVGNSGKVYAFEPDPNTFEILKENLRLSKCNNVIVSQIALSNRDTNVILSKPSEEYGDAFNFIKFVDFKNESTIKTQTLDNFLEINGVKGVEFIKIDVEGAELLCFLGAQKTLENSNSLFIVSECYEKYLLRFGHKISDLLIYMDQLKYECFNYDDWQWYFQKRTCDNLEDTSKKP
jgi:FkbM family methyltransferase